MMPVAPRWLVVGPALALFFATALLFSRARENDFVNYDDNDYVTANEHVKAGLTLAGVKWAFTSTEASNWHPLTWLSHMLDVSLFGERPAGHHATSVRLHALNASLAFLALWRLTGACWTSAAFAALFAWHPLRVESVAWVAERKDVLSGFFFFLTLWLYADYARRREERSTGARMRYAGVLVAFALGLMAKPMLVTLPCVLLLLDVWPLRRFALPPDRRGAAKLRADSALRLLVEKLPLFALTAASCAITYIAQKGGGSVSQALAFPARLANAVVSVPRYVGKFFAPVQLAVLYPHPGHWPAGAIAAAAFFLVAVTALAVWQMRPRPWLLVGWLWFLVMLVPVSGVVQVGLQSMADRYTYLPMLGVELMLLWSLRELVTGAPAAERGLAAAAVVVLGAGAFGTWRQLDVWRNSSTLFTDAIAHTRDNYLAYNNRGLDLFRAGRVAEAEADYRRALAAKPDYPEANNNLGHLLAEQGHPREAIPLYRAALVGKPQQLEIHNNLANALADTGQMAEALQHYDYVLARNPRHVDALNNDGVALAMSGRLAEGRAKIEQSLQIAPNRPDAESNLGNICAMLGDRAAALAHYRRALELQPESGTFYNLGNVQRELGQLADAAASYERAVQLNERNTDAHAALGFVLAQLGRRDEALRHLRLALAQQPAHPQAAAWRQAVDQAK